MFKDNKIYFAKCGENLERELYLLPNMANRHGFICGATGTGKTITLKVLAESFSDMGVPVFLADVKGDLSGMLEEGVDSENMQKRIARFNLANDGFNYDKYPVNFYDIYNTGGIPLRVTISEMGPQLLSTILELNDTQSDVLSVAFKIADDEGLLLVDTKDLKALLNYLSENNNLFKAEYGNIAPQSVAAIIRSIVALESEGGDSFFGETGLDIVDFFQNDMRGKGMINILDSSKLISKPRLYSAFMLYLISELYETLPEVGDLDKPRMIFFFDEAHILFNNADKSLLEKIEQTVKLIRSKGVGIYFITQSPRDIPDAVMAQLGNKIEHALRAYTPNERKALKVAAEAFRENPNFKTEELLENLGIGEAIVSMLDEKGIPTICEHAYILPPKSLMGPADPTKVENNIKTSNLYLKYSRVVDNESAYELLLERSEQMLAEENHRKALELQAKQEAKEKQRYQKQISRSVRNVGKTAAGSVGREIGNAIGGSFGSFGKRLGGNVGASLARNIFGTLFKH